MLLQRLARPLKGVVSHGLAQPARRLHVPGRIHLLVPANLSQQAQSLFARVISNLETVFNTTPTGRAFHSNVACLRPSYSFPTRVALSRGFGAPHLPRPPRVPGNITQVGLGTARNFSSARPIFQNLVQNVPVAGRAMYEVDWDLKMRDQHQSAIRMHKKSSKKTKGSKNIDIPLQPITPVVASAYDETEELDHYFHTPAAPSVITYLQIPLAPTPTTRVPLQSSPPDHLVPLSTVMKEHALHSKHGIRVSSLFRRLDAAKVWERGASCETYGDPSGMCTVLQVKFEGWTEEMVREVIGTAGKDWCNIQEVYPLQQDPNGVDSLFPPTLSDPWASSPSNPESGVTYIMPTIDASLHFISEEAPSFPTSDGESEFSFAARTEYEWDSDMGDFSTPPMVGSDLNPEDEWSSIRRSASSGSDSEVSVGFTTTNFQGTLLFH